MKLFTILLNIAKRIKTSFTRLTTLETWKSGIVDTVSDEGSNYIRFSNGLQLCWGSTGQGVEIDAGYSYADKTITFPKAFVNTSYFVTYGTWTTTTAVQNVGVNVTYSRSKTSMVVRVWRNVNTTTYGAAPAFDWVAIGTWK